MPAVEVDDLAAARPRVRRIVAQARALVGGDDEGDVLERAAAVDDRPPVHRLGRAPRIHVGRDADQHLGAVGRELADRLGKEPVVADGAAEPADRRVGHREQRLVVAGEVVRAGVDLVRNPRVDLAVLVEDPLGPDQAGRVEDDARPARIDLDHRAALDVDVVLPRLGARADRCARSGSARPASRAARRRSRRPARRARTPERRRAGPAGTARCRRPPSRSSRACDRCSPRICRAVERVGEVGLARGGGVAEGHRPSGRLGGAAIERAAPARPRRACCSARGSRRARRVADSARRRAYG